MLSCIALLLATSVVAQTPDTMPVAPQPSPAAPTTLTLPEALERALAANPSIGRSAAEIQVAQEQKNIFRSAVLPRLAVTGSAIHNTEDVTFGSGTDERTVLPGNDWNYRLVLSQPIFAGLREARAYSQAKIGIENAVESNRSTVDTVLLRVAANYLAVLESDALIDVERKNIALAEGRRKQAQDLFDAGETTKVDVLRANTAIQEAKRSLASAEQQRELSASRLRTDLAIDGPVGVVQPDNVLPPVPADTAALETQAEENRPEVATAKNNLRIAELEVKKQKGAYLPVVTADAGYIKQKTTFPTDQYGYGALRFSVPIYQGGEVGARVAQAKARQLQAQLDLENARLQVREDVRNSWVALKTAETNLALANDQLSAAQAEYDQVLELYRAQEATSLDLDDAERKLADARRNVVATTLQRNLAHLALSYATGSIKNALMEKH